MHISLAVILFVAALGIVGILAIRSSDKSPSVGDDGETDVDLCPMSDAATGSLQTAWICDEEYSAAGPGSFSDLNPPQCPVDESDSHLGAFTGHDWGVNEVESEW